MIELRQSSHRLLMVRPLRFGFNLETASSNAFQHDVASSVESCAQEFDEMVQALRDWGLDVSCYPATSEESPDALFPNNWVSFHEGGLSILYPMMSPNRRREVQPSIIEDLHTKQEVATPTLIDLTSLAEEGVYLEGTGSLVLDRVNKLAFACLSPRTHPAGVEAFASATNYDSFQFRARDERGQAIYHTNVMLALGTDFAVICSVAISDREERRAALHHLQSTGRSIIDVSWEQMSHFCCNVLEVQLKEGRHGIVMSERARRAFTTQQLSVLDRCGSLISVPLENIETVGGGSARCMLAEVF